MAQKIFSVSIDRQLLESVDSKRGSIPRASIIVTLLKGWVDGDIDIEFRSKGTKIIGRDKYGRKIE